MVHPNDLVISISGWTGDAPDYDRSINGPICLSPVPRAAELCWTLKSTEHRINQKHGKLPPV